MLVYKFICFTAQGFRGRISQRKEVSLLPLVVLDACQKAREWYVHGVGRNPVLSSVRWRAQEGYRYETRDTFLTCTLMLFDSGQYPAVTDSTWFEQTLSLLVLAFLSKVVQIKFSSGWLLCNSPGRRSAFLLPSPSQQARLKPVREGRVSLC